MQRSSHRYDWVGNDTANKFNAAVEHLSKGLEGKSAASFISIYLGIGSEDCKLRYQTGSALHDITTCKEKINKLALTLDGKTRNPLFINLLDKLFVSCSSVIIDGLATGENSQFLDILSKLTSSTTELRLHNLSINSAAAKKIAETIARLTHLKKIVIANCAFDQSLDVALVLQAITQKTSIDYLDLSGTKSARDHTGIIAAAIPQLKHLDLSSIEMSEAQAITLFNAAQKKNPHLKNFSISHNKINVTSNRLGYWINLFLGNCPTLREFNIEANALHCVTIKEIAEALIFHPALENAYLRQCSIDYHGGVALVSAYEKYLEKVRQNNKFPRVPLRLHLSNNNMVAVKRQALGILANSFVAVVGIASGLLSTFAGVSKSSQYVRWMKSIKIAANVDFLAAFSNISLVVQNFAGFIGGFYEPDKLRAIQELAEQFSKITMARLEEDVQRNKGKIRHLKKEIVLLNAELKKCVESLKEKDERLAFVESKYRLACLHVLDMTKLTLKRDAVALRSQPLCENQQLKTAFNALNVSLDAYEHCLDMVGSKIEDIEAKRLAFGAAIKEYHHQFEIAWQTVMSIVGAFPTAAMTAVIEKRTDDSLRTAIQRGENKIIEKGIYQGISLLWLLIFYDRFEEARELLASMIRHNHVPSAVDAVCTAEGPFKNVSVGLLLATKYNMLNDENEWDFWRDNFFTNPVPSDSSKS